MLGRYNRSAHILTVSTRAIIFKRYLGTQHLAHQTMNGGQVAVIFNMKYERLHYINIM